MADEKPEVQSVTIQPHPLGAGYGLNAHMTTIGNFGRRRPVTRLLPECFQTVEAAQAFALGELDLEPRHIRLGRGRRS